MEANAIGIVDERENRRKGLITSIIVHSLLLLLLILPFISFPIPPPGQQGILVSFGTPDVGQGTDRPLVQNEVPKPAEPQASTALPVKEPEPEPEVEESMPAVSEAPDLITSAEPEEVTVDPEQERLLALVAEAERQKQQEIEQAKRQAELEAQRQAELEAQKQRAYEESKQQYSDLFKGTGSGTTDEAGNQGVENGDPDAAALEGISTGSGMVGGGLSNRGVVYKPRIEDRSQKKGKVVVAICVDSSGEVISANYTQRGSNTTDSELRRIAERSASQFKFNTSQVEKQCGTVTIDFKVQ